MQTPELTIILPNYKTPELTKLCLGAIRRHTDLERIRLIAVDNDSADESLEYLRSQDWITLVERKTDGESAPLMHSRALDLAMTMVDTPFVLVMHTDTIILRKGWMDFLLNKVKASPDTAGTGSWKLESISPLKAFFKRLETAARRMIGRKILDREHYFRSHCALYRTAAVRKTAGFDDGSTAGESLFRTLREKGYKLPFIQSEELSRYMCHLNHATMILNPQGKGHKTSSAGMKKKLDRKLKNLIKDIQKQEKGNRDA